MQSFAFQVVVYCPVETAFSVYTDTDRWRNRHLFGDIRWVQGNPWEEGSRLRIETRTPIPTKIDQVLLHFERNRKVVYISHVLGITIETQVTFFPLNETQSAIHVAMQLVGTVSRALGFAIEPVIERSTRDFFAELVRECEVVAHKGEGAAGSAG